MLLSQNELFTDILIDDMGLCFEAMDTKKQYENEAWKNKKIFLNVIFYISFITKQFYIFPSGSIGIADLFFAAAGILTLYTAWKDGKKVWYQEDSPWIVFLIFATIINGIYFIRTSKWNLPLHTLYWIYSAFLIWTFRTLYSEYFMAGLCNRHPPCLSE